MPAEVWTRQELYNFIRAIYAAKLAPTELPAEDRWLQDDCEPGARLQSYVQGCRVAVRSLLLVFGFPLDALAHPTAEPTEWLNAVEVWFAQDLQNLTVSLLLSASPMLEFAQDERGAREYLQGFYDTLSSLLQALGIPLGPLKEAAAQVPALSPTEGKRPRGRRYWQGWS
ncbi:MAG: hypothetical protein JXA37_07845 [Chloroflexia bacterium]|nr:hypothetical protein [Chloroflexia bacterium]